MNAPCNRTIFTISTRVDCILRHGVKQSITTNRFYYRPRELHNGLNVSNNGGDTSIASYSSYGPFKSRTLLETFTTTKSELFLQQPKFYPAFIKHGCFKRFLTNNTRSSRQSVDQKESIKNYENEDNEEDKLETPKKINTISRIDQEGWNQMLQDLIDYKQEYGDCLVPKAFAPNEKLGLWGKSKLMVTI